MLTFANILKAIGEGFFSCMCSPVIPITRIEVSSLVLKPKPITDITPSYLNGALFNLF